jgi:lipoate-protein ligase A
MTALEFPLLQPAEILAMEELLLDAAEVGNAGETLAFWESAQHFIVLGYGNKAATETNQSVCNQLGIPILRRISGGGTVLQGPGVLNYSLVLRATEGTPFAAINGANRFIMERNAAALTATLGRKVEVQGHTDLTITGRKFSGNAQRRKRTHLLFHGAILLNLNLDLLEQVLPMPSLEPDYRGGRKHRDFLTQLSAPATIVKEALKIAWGATKTDSLDNLGCDWRACVTQLVAERYSRDDWNFRV